MKELKLNIHSYNLFYLFFCVIWSPLQMVYLHIDGANRTLITITIITLLLNVSTIRKTKLFKSSAFVCWFILVFYTFVNYFIRGVYVGGVAFSFFFINTLLPLVCLLILIIELKDNEIKCLKVFMIAQLIYVLIGATHISFVQFDRSGSEELGNALPTMASGLVFTTGLLLCKHHLKGGWWSFVLIVALAIYICVVTATRKAFGGVFIIVIGVLLGYYRKINIKTMLLLFIASIVVYVGVDWVIDNTYLGERILENSDNLDYPLVSNPKINALLMKVLGDRSVQYYTGLQIYHEHPVFGIGLNNFSDVSQQSIRLHTEYIIHLCENGFVGFCLLMLYYFLLFKGLNNKRKDGYNSFIYLFGLLYVLFLNLTAWTYNSLLVMFIYANIICYISQPNEISFAEDKS